MLAGITIKPIKCLLDERGSFSEIMRKDWKDLFGDDNIAQSNLSITYPGIIRAWHRHLKGQTDYFIALKGAIKICAFDEKTKELNEIVSTGQIPQIVRMPGNYSQYTSPRLLWGEIHRHDDRIQKERPEIWAKMQKQGQRSWKENMDAKSDEGVGAKKGQ